MEKTKSSKPKRPVIFFYADEKNKAFIRKLAKKCDRSITFCMNEMLTKARTAKYVGNPKQS